MCETYIAEVKNCVRLAYAKIKEGVSSLIPRIRVFFFNIIQINSMEDTDVFVYV